MKREKGAELMNKLVAANITQEGPELLVDYSNVVDFGKAISDSIKITDPTFANTLGGMIDKVGKTEFNVGSFTSVAPNVWKDSTGWANMLEEVDISVGDFNDSKYFNLLEGGSISEDDVNSFEALFGTTNTPTVTAKYYNTILNYENKITLADRQWKEAFVSPDAMDRFFSSIEARKMQKLNWSKDQLAFLAFDAMVLEAVADQNNVKQLATGTAGKIDEKSIAQLNDLIDELKVYSTAYSGFETSVDKSELNIALYAPLYNEFIASKSGYHNPEFLDIPFEKIQKLPYFQYYKTDKAERNVISGKTPTTANSKHRTVKDIVAVIWHDRACGLYNKDERVAVQRVANEWATNFFHDIDVEMVVRSDFPCIVITKNAYATDVTETNDPAKTDQT